MLTTRGRLGAAAGFCTWPGLEGPSPLCRQQRPAPSPLGDCPPPQLPEEEGHPGPQGTRASFIQQLFLSPSEGPGHKCRRGLSKPAGEGTLTGRKGSMRPCTLPRNPPAAEAGAQQEPLDSQQEGRPWPLARHKQPRASGLSPCLGALTCGWRERTRVPAVSASSHDGRHRHRHDLHDLLHHHRRRHHHHHHQSLGGTCFQLRSSEGRQTE